MINSCICSYFHLHDLPPFEHYKDIPLAQIMWIVKNIQKIDIEKCSEVFFRIMFHKIKPGPRLSFKDEIARIKVCSKLNSFKKMYVKRLFYSIGCIKSQSETIQKEEKNINVIQMLQKESIEKIHSDYFPSLMLFHDKLIVLSMKEVVDMMKMVKISQRLFDSMPKEDFRKMAWLLCSNNISEIPVVKDILEMAGKFGMDARSGEGGGGDGVSVVGDDNSSLFNFSNHLAQLSAGGFSFAFSNINF